MVLKLRDGYTYPGHNYLGPGNTIYKDDEPVDEVDFDAYIHDLQYELATNKEQIREADRHAIQSFISDYHKNGSLAELSGIIGLSLKYGFESAFGVQYPSMSNDKQKTLPQLVYASRERHLAQEWANIKDTPDKGGYRNFQDFKTKSLIAKRIYESYKVGGYYYSALERDFNASRAESTRTDNGPAAKRPRPESPDNSDSSAEQSPTFIEKPNHNNNPNPTMDVDQENIYQQSGSGRGPNTGARSGATGSGDPTTSNITWIRPSTPCSNNYMHFSKSRILVSYGYSTENIQVSDSIDQITTSLALIPVDYVPFYLSEAEFDMLPTTAKVMKVTCQVTPLGTRTAFDVGSTLSGTATSEYVPIGLVAEGLNKQFYGKNVNYTSEGTNPMKVTGVQTINVKEMHEKYYKHIPSNALCVPQTIHEYFVHEWNREKNPDTSKFPDYIIHDKGSVRMDEKVHQFLINQAVGVPIASYEYKPKSGFIKKGKEHFVPYTRLKYKVHSNVSRPHSHVLQFFKAGNKPISGDIGLSKTPTIPIVINNINDVYARTIESYGTYHPIRGGFGYDTQPQLHVGIVATPQLKPTDSQASYLNSACYWKVECSIEIQCNISSAFGKGTSVSWPLEVSFTANYDRAYTDGQTLFGVTDDDNGRVAAILNENNDDEDNEYDQDYEVVNKTKKMKI